MQNSILQQRFILQPLWLPKYGSLRPPRPLRQGAKQVSEHAKHPHTTMKHNTSFRYGSLFVCICLGCECMYTDANSRVPVCEGLGLLLERHNKENGVTRIKEVVRGLGADISRQVCVSKKKECSHLFRSLRSSKLIFFWPSMYTHFVSLSRTHRFSSKIYC